MEHPDISELDPQAVEERFAQVRALHVEIRALVEKAKKLSDKNRSNLYRTWNRRRVLLLLEQADDLGDKCDRLMGAVPPQRKPIDIGPHLGWLIAEAFAGIWIALAFFWSSENGYAGLALISFASFILLTILSSKLFGRAAKQHTN